MKVNVYRWKTGVQNLIYVDVNSEQPNTSTGIIDLLGTKEIDIEPVQREVEHEVPTCQRQVNGTYLNDTITCFVPKNAYGVKITYKIKEPV